jgi:7,8-dihydro-6-hydroxymethylpterin-pyrophosphokinase
MGNISPQNALIISTFISSYKHLTEIEKKLFPKKIQELFNAKIQFKSTKTLDVIALEIIKELLDTPPLKFPCINKFIESDLFQCCKLLVANQLFSDENAIAILSYPKPKKSAPNGDYQSLNSPKLQQLFTAICTLQEHKLLEGTEKQEYFSAIVQHETSPQQVAQALTTLNRADLLNAQNIAVTTHPVNPAAAAKILTLITSLGLLSGEHAEKNFERMMKNQKPANLLLDIELLAPEDDKLQEKFERIMRPRAYTRPLRLSEVIEGQIAAIEIDSPLINTHAPKGVIATMIPGAF